jgi:hypothetical protein
MHIYLHKLGTCCIVGPNGPWPGLIADVAAYAGTRFVHALCARPTACSSLPPRQSRLGLSLPRRVVCACLGQPRPSPSLCQEAVGQVPPRLPEPSAISSVVSARRATAPTVASCSTATAACTRTWTPCTRPKLASSLRGTGLLSRLPLTNSWANTLNMHTSLSRQAWPVKKLSYAYPRCLPITCVECCVAASCWMMRAKPKSPSPALRRRACCRPV